MKHLMLGMVLGSLLTATIVGAGTFYNSKGEPAAPRGSTQQFDYFRQRQQFLDIQHMRQQADRDRLDNQLHPCAK
jgi:hypothetical protein